MAGTLQEPPAVDGLRVGPEISIAVKSHKAKQVERAIIAEFLVIVEVPEPSLQNTNFWKTAQLAALSALHVAPPSNVVIPDLSARR